MRLLMVIQGDWGKRIANYVESVAPTSWMIARWQAPAVLPRVIDDPDEFLPPLLDEADLLLVLTESPGLTDLAPDLAERCGAQAVIVPVDKRIWGPPGLIRQTGERLENQGVASAFPQPFCSLHPSQRQHPLIQAFAERFGHAELTCRIEEGVIVACELSRGAPCGNTQYIVDNLPGVETEAAAEQAGLLHHYYPCWGDMGNDPVHGEHTLLHIAAGMSQKAVSRAIKAAEAAAAEIDPQDLQKRISDVESRLAEARARLPKHSPSVSLSIEIDDLEDELARLSKLNDANQVE